MCGDVFNINAVNRFAPRKYAVKCGICKECRTIEQNSWSFRLRCELEDCHNKGWQIGFVTLTYDDEHLPHIPDELADLSKTSFEALGPCCFNKSQVRDFIIRVRKSLYDQFDVGKGDNKDNIRYLVASEFGKSTKRPHYHAVFSFPPYVPAEDMYNIIRSKWEFGFVFPKVLNGGIDSHGYVHQPFLVTNNPYGCCKYIAKYISKDLDFYYSLSDFYPLENVDLSNYMPFHIQSKGLGYDRFKHCTDSQKLDYILKGYSFIGDDKLVPIPLYIRRKFFFSPHYIVNREIYRCGSRVDVSDDVLSELSDDELKMRGYSVNYTRLVRRKATQFFKNNFELIYQRQLDVYSKLFSNVLDKDFLVKRGLSEENASSFTNFLNNDSGYEFSAKDLARLYLTYHGLPITKCFDVSPSYQWFLRYDSDDEYDTTGFKLIDSDLFDFVQNILPLVVNLCVCTKVDYTFEDKLTAAVFDFWKSAV